MPTIEELQIKAGLYDIELAGKADISDTTYRRMKQGKRVSKVVIGKVLRVLSKELGYEININDVQGLNY